MRPAPRPGGELKYFSVPVITVDPAVALLIMLFAPALVPAPGGLHLSGVQGVSVLDSGPGWVAFEIRGIEGEGRLLFSAGVWAGELEVNISGAVIKATGSGNVLVLELFGDPATVTSLVARAALLGLPVVPGANVTILVPKPGEDDRVDISVYNDTVTAILSTQYTWIGENGTLTIAGYPAVEGIPLETPLGRLDAGDIGSANTSSTLLLGEGFSIEANSTLLVYGNGTLYTCNGSTVLEWEWVKTVKTCGPRPTLPIRRVDATSPVALVWIPVFIIAVALILYASRP